MTREQKDRMIMVKVPLDFVENSISELDQNFDQMKVPYEHLVALLSAIPGVKRSSAITLISDIGIDMPQKMNDQQNYKAFKLLIIRISLL